MTHSLNGPRITLTAAVNNQTEEYYTVSEVGKKFILFTSILAIILFDRMT